ncbi:MAG: folate-binding protein YgfZ [Proteobacteria bacterium]|jgi:tRNA-modifying protein YgfZ|nr:folate-binding protein YgfZ [Pseudomonadota bacterium]
MLSPANFLDAILVRGEDRLAFLQGQLSCDLINAEGSIQLAAMCNPKGRIIALFHVICAHETVYLIGRRAIIESAATHLKRFIFRSKVTIEHQQPVTIYLSVGVNEKDEPALLPGTIQELDSGSVRARLANPNSLELVLSTNTIANDNNPHTEAIWSRSLHINGIPEITPEQSEKYLPESLNLDLSGGINFDKGCYTGQEVIARMHYLGKAKKRLYQITTDEPARLEPGMPVFNQHGTELGEIFSVSLQIDYEARQVRSMESTDIENLVQADQIGLAILANGNDKKNDNDTHQSHRYWLNYAPNHPQAIGISAVLPVY